MNDYGFTKIEAVEFLVKKDQKPKNLKGKVLAKLNLFQVQLKN